MYCQEKYILGELPVRTDTESVGRARVRPYSVTRRPRTGIILTVEVAVESSPTGQRAPRYAFVARIKATDTISGMHLEGLTTDLSEGGCRISTRRGPFSEGTPILLEITKNDVSLVTNATVVYNLKDQFMGICFEEMPPDQAAILAGWISAASAAVNPRRTAP